MCLGWYASPVESPPALAMKQLDGIDSPYAFQPDEPCWVYRLS